MIVSQVGKSSRRKTTASTQKRREWVKVVSYEASYDLDDCPAISPAKKEVGAILVLVPFDSM